MTAANEREAGVLRAALDQLGIDNWQQTDGPMLAYLAASMDNWASITVRERDVARAREAISGLREDSVDIDWDEVDVGEPVDRIAAKIARRPDEAARRPGWRRLCRVGIQVFAGVFLALSALYVVGLIWFIASEALHSKGQP